MSDGERAIDEIRTLGEELRAIFVEERRAIAALDHVRLGELAAAKADVAARLETACTATPPTAAANVRAVLVAIRAEAHATSMLARAATDAVNALLGIERTGYDRRARLTESPRVHLLTTS